MGVQGPLPGVSAPTPPRWSIWRGGIGLGKAERTGLFLRPGPSPECLRSGKLGPRPRPQLGLQGTSPQLTKSEPGPSWPGKVTPPSRCSLQAPSLGSPPWFPQKGRVASGFSKRAMSFLAPLLEGAVLDSSCNARTQCLTQGSDAGNKGDVVRRGIVLDVIL